MEKKVDILRWSDIRNFNPAWGHRSEVVSHLINEGEVILDIGCGTMYLEKCLPLSCKYIPCDIVKRDSRTYVLDFNKDELPNIEGITTITLLGVVEYMIDVKKFLISCKKYNARIMMSYTIVEYAHRDLRWFNCYSKQDLYEIFHEAGYELKMERWIDADQWLFELIPKKNR